MATATAEKTENKPIHPIVSLQAQLEKRASELSRALPAHMPAERFIRVVLTACQLNPDLLACDRTSLWNACMRAAQDGLLPDGREGAIVPYKDKAQWMPMTQGLLKRFRNSGQFKSITAGIVRETEPFEHWVDENGEHLKHAATLRRTRLDVRGARHRRAGDYRQAQARRFSQGRKHRNDRRRGHRDRDRCARSYPAESTQTQNPSCAAVTPSSSSRPMFQSGVRPNKQTNL